MAPESEMQLENKGYEADDEMRHFTSSRAVKRKKHLCSCPTLLPVQLNSITTTTVTKTDTSIKTIHHTSYGTKTVVSERLLPETTIIKEHWRTHFQDHWTTVTPPTITQTMMVTGYETTVTLPAHTEVSYHYIPCAEEITVLKHLGRLALFSWLLVLAWCMYAFRTRRRHRRRDQIVQDTTNAFHEA